MNKKLRLLFCFATLLAGNIHAQSVCDSTGNLIIYSNYDGGDLTINVDVNIPNLRIGVLSYEFTRITLTGAYVNNVIEVAYIGADANNNHCNLPLPHASSITGAPSSATTSISLFPTASYTNANGYGSMICAYSCDITTSQGGCNTVDQVVHYFMQTLGGTLYAHRVQYGCWPTQSVPVSAGGNCCIVPPITTSVQYQQADVEGLSAIIQQGMLMTTMPAAASGQAVKVEVFDAQGRVIFTETTLPGNTQSLVDVQALPAGLIVVRASWSSGVATTRLINVQ